jgi:hypothetical protein
MTRTCSLTTGRGRGRSGGGDGVCAAAAARAVVVANGAVGACATVLAVGVDDAPLVGVSARADVELFDDAAAAASDAPVAGSLAGCALWRDELDGGMTSKLDLVRPRPVDGHPLQYKRARESER